VEAEAPPFRFSRMGPNGAGRQLPDGTIARLGSAMVVGGGGSSQIPAGFTYLGQFVDHDLTFDKTSVAFGDSVSPADLLQARSPSLDLDSLYGAGPADPESAKFYEADGIHLKMGKTVGFEGEAPREGFDLPRGAGDTRAKKRKAIIPDPRNDENLAVAQTHLAFIRFHNRVADSLPSSLSPTERFSRARRQVIRHYQWMLRTDFLPRICQASVVNNVFSNGRKIFEVGATPTDVPTMPIEFSVAAFRLGHSMIRRAYNWNSIFDFNSGTLELLFRFSGGSGNLDRQLRLLSIWIADFRRLYAFREAGRDDLAVPAAQFNRTMRIDTSLVDPLRDLPRVADETNLATRNLTRAKMVRLATGQQMAAFLRSKGVSVTTLTRSEIRNGSNGAVLDGLTPAQRDAVLRNTPLWFYILREAELGGGRLRGVGARIVAETFHRAMEGSQVSIVRDPTWRPSLGPNSNTFRMVDLLLFAFRGRRNLLAPVG
jgi:Animal haem peroxidase